MTYDKRGKNQYGTQTVQQGPCKSVTACGEKESRDETKNGSDWVGSGMSKKVYRRG